MNIAFKPNPLAALETLGKIASAAFFLVLPVMVGLFASGRAVSAVAILGAAQGGAIYIAVITAILPGVRLFFTTYQVEEKGIRVTLNFVQKESQFVTWERITSIEHHRGFMDFIFGLERITISAFGEKGTILHLVGIKGGAQLTKEFALRMGEFRTAQHVFSDD